MLQISDDIINMLCTYGKPNGVRLYLYLDKNMKKSFVSYGVFYGSSGEYSDFYLDGVKHHVLPGCAHFLEHLLLEHSKYGHLYRKFAQKKYVTNGLTYMDCTNYFFLAQYSYYFGSRRLAHIYRTSHKKR